MCCCLQCFNGTVHCQIDRCVFVCCWQSYRKVELEPGSQEYDWVSAAFHETMSWPRAYILHIHRVQNLTLWQFYLVCVHTHTHTHRRSTALCPGETSLDFTEARDSEWQWHQLGHVQVWTSLQTDNHASTPPLSFLQAGCPSCCLTNNVKALINGCELIFVKNYLQLVCNSHYYVSLGFVGRKIHSKFRQGVW